MDKQIKELLYKSFDSNLSSEEMKLLENALSESEELRNEKEMIASIREKIKTGKTESFDSGFADRVMENIQSSMRPDENEQFFESLSVIFRPIAIAATVVIIIIAGYNMNNTGNYSLEGALGIPEVTVDDIYDPSLALVMEE